MKLSLKLALAMGALVAVLVVASMVSIGAYLYDTVQQQLGADLDRTSAQLLELQQARLDGLVLRNRVVADEPRLKATVTSEIDEQTTRDVARDMREVARADLFLMLTPEGVVRANATADGSPGPALPQNMPALIERALNEGRGDLMGAWTLQGDLYLVAGHAVTLGAKAAGFLITGERIDDRAALRMRRETGSELLLITNGRITAAALDEHLRGKREALTREVMRMQQSGQGRDIITVGDARYLAQVTRVIRLAGAGPKDRPAAFFVMVRSLDEALTTYRTIRKDLLRLGGIGLGLALLAALILASTLTRRVGTLARATALVAGGDLDTAVPVGGSDEIGALGRAFNDMIAKLRISREELRNKERLERELEIATVIQTLLLPAQPTLDGFDVAARMMPAEEVGGDFYDLHQTPYGSWVAIGDVSGHGVTSGLIMMMVQSMLSSIARQPPHIQQLYTPKEVLRIINAALYENLRVRMHDDNYMTMVLLQHLSGGRFRFAGAHEAILLYRAATHQVETLGTDGTWLGVQDDIGPYLQEHEMDLRPGDALLLYTDGVTEAKNAQGVQYNTDRLRDTLLRAADAQRANAERIRDAVIEDVCAWSRIRQDDITVLVLRRPPVEEPSS